MSHLAFNETFMGAGEPLKGSQYVGFGAGNRVPETSRNGRNRPKVKKVTDESRKGLSGKPVESSRTGLARSSVAVVRLTPKTYEVRVKGSRKLVGLVNKYSVSDGKAVRYSFCSTSGEAVKDFTSQKAAVEAMLKVS
jgi:hypothetical protein